jgi:ferric-dicitrate binding protein FerR (iron transport regulator)
MNEESRRDILDDADVAALLRSVGPRPSASAQAMAEARAAVAAEWRATVAARRRRRQITGWATAASVAMAAVAVWIVRPLVQPEAQAVASLVRVVGSVEQNRGDGRWTPLAAADSIETGTRLRTATDGRAALQLSSGVQIRLDSRTLVALDDSSHATLASGAVYVDTGVAAGTPGPDFELETPAGRVRHLGTQYEARFEDSSLHVGVREGRVQVSSAAGDVLGDAGERLTITGDRVSRSVLPRTAAAWNWLGSITPPHSIEGRSVESFLVWAARETGRTIVYTSPDAARRARSVTLSGTVEGLTPDEAVAAVLSTTSLQPELGVEHIRIGAADR